MKLEKGVLFGSLSNDLKKQNKCEKWKEVNELAESLDWPSQYFCDSVWQGRIQIFRGLKLIQFLGFSLRKRIQNYEYKIKYETEWEQRMGIEITTNYKLKEADILQTSQNSEKWHNIFIN
jgi:hypothetical protein